MPPGMLKEGVEQALSTRTFGRIVRHRILGKRLILAYHGILPEGETRAGERALFVTERDFGRHLDILGDFADVAPLDKLDEPGDGRPRVAITFDDAYQGAVEHGVRELAKRSLPATIFVAPGRLDRHVFWWDALSQGGAQLDEGVRHQALYRLAGSDERVRRWAAQAHLHWTDSVPEYARTATLDELQRAVKTPGITLGSHTWSHFNLAALAASDVTSEIEFAHDWLRAKFHDKAIPWLAYPYGMDSVYVHRAAAIASCTGGLRIGGGWHDPSEMNAFARPRLNVAAGLSVAGFRARLLGAVLP
ncbi:MAG: polysaccharide deacetylase family protein [Gemmatimonadaceae bacterium]